jgi:hypothetical protein
MKKLMLGIFIIIAFVVTTYLAFGATYLFSDGGVGWVHYGPDEADGRPSSGTGVTYSPGSATIVSYEVWCKGTTPKCYHRTATTLYIHNSGSLEDGGELSGSGHKE